MLSDIGRALGQLGDGRFLSVLLFGVGLTVALLFGLAAAVFWAVGLVVPPVFTLPWVGEVTWAADVLSWAGAALVLVLSPFLMIPVAGAFTGLFLDRVADAVEARHYPGLPPTPGTPVLTALIDALGFLGLVVFANLVALVLYLLVAPLAPVIFWIVNGFLLGREYFTMAALRRMDRRSARALWRRNMGELSLMGGLIAMALTVPVANLLVPVLAAAAFTHAFHRLTR
jgi:CysZ protein